MFDLDQLNGHLSLILTLDPNVLKTGNGGVKNIKTLFYGNYVGHLNKTFYILENYNILNNFYANQISPITTIEKNLIFKVFSNINKTNPNLNLEKMGFLSDFFYNVNRTLNTPTVFFILRISREIEYITSVAGFIEEQEFNLVKNFNSYVQFCLTLDPVLRYPSLVRMTNFVQNNIDITEEIKANSVFLENEHKSLVQTMQNLLKNKETILEKFNHEKDKKFVSELSTAINREIKQIKNDPQTFQERSVQNFFVKNFEEKTEIKTEPQIKETTSFLGRTINCFTRTLSFLKFW